MKFSGLRSVISWCRQRKWRKHREGKVDEEPTKLAHKVHRLLDKLLDKLQNDHHQESSCSSNEAEEIMKRSKHVSQLFTEVANTAAQDPSSLWSEDLRKAPLPTNTFWLNYVLKDGSQPEYIHPYLVQSTPGSFTVCYPSRTVSSAFIIQAFTQDLTVSHGRGNVPHVVSHYDDLSVTLEIPNKRLKAPLVRGSPYVTLVFKGGISADHQPVTLSTVHAVLDLWSNPNNTKHRLVLNNGQTWCVYASSPLELNKEGVSVCRGRKPFSGVLRLALLPSAESERTLDAFSGVYPVRGHATFDKPFSLGFQWKTRGGGNELLMLSLPMHKQLLTFPSLSTCRAPELSYNSIDGKLEGIVGDKWLLQASPVSTGWYSDNGISDGFSRDRIKHALDADVSELNSIATESSYFYGKAVARAARMVLIAEEVGHYGVIEKLRSFLQQSLTPWMDGSFARNGIVYDAKWGGLVSRNGAKDPGADFGIAVYNDHHYHWGYFIYAGAVLAKIDNAWARAYREHLYTLMEDYMSFQSDGCFPRLRCFDLWLMHSWAGGVTEFADGRNQESTSEAVNAYYSAALLGMAYGDPGLINHGLTLTALEIHAAKSLWFVSSDSRKSIYEEEFTRENRVVGVLWANKRDTGLWFAGAEMRECRVGIQVLPLSPITQKLFEDGEFVREMVSWTWPRVQLNSVADGWKGFVYALQAVYGDREAALGNTMALKAHDDGNSLSNMLWWILSRC